MEYYGNKLCISYHELVDSGIMTEPNYKYKAWKGQIDVVRRGGGANGCCALIADKIQGGCRGNVSRWRQGSHQDVGAFQL